MAASNPSTEEHKLQEQGKAACEGAAGVLPAQELSRGGRDACPTLTVETPLPQMRLWFAGLLLWLALLTASARLAFGWYEAGATWAGGVWILALMCFYLTLCNALLPLPTGWIVMLAATNQVADYAEPWSRVLLVAVLGGLATTMANLNEYHILSHPRGARFRDRLRRSTPYQWAIRWFRMAPFQTLLLVAFIPIPVDVVRWLAILQRYCRVRFAAAYFVGRSVRYMLFAGIAVMWRLNWWQILLVQLGVLLIALLSRLVWRPSAARSDTLPSAATPTG